MSEITPQQMRELAERLPQIAESQRMDFDSPHVAMTLDESADVLRAAADQLEAVQRIADLYEYVGLNDVPADVVAWHLRNILTADNAPQEDCDEG